MDSNPPSSVQTQETNDSNPTPVPYAKVARSKCGLEFVATQEIYRSFDAIEGTEREERLLACRSSAWFVRNTETGMVRVAANHCRLRWCPMCSQSRSGFIAAQVKEWLSGTRRPKMLTLTLKHSNSDLSTQIDRIYSSFRGMRRTKWWKSLCYGGVWFFQVTYNPQSKEWHPHIHILLDSEFIPYLEIRQKWYYYTSGSDIIDIRPVYSTVDISQYVARYASRPHTLQDLPFKSAKDLVTTMHGRRMCGSWGSGKLIKMSPYNAPKSDEWTNVGSWERVHRLAMTVTAARQILKAYHTNQPLDQKYTVHTEEYETDTTISFVHPQVLLDPIPPPPSLFH